MASHEAILFTRLENAERHAKPSECRLNKLERVAQITVEIAKTNPLFLGRAAEAQLNFADEYMTSGFGPSVRMAREYIPALKLVDRAFEAKPDELEKDRLHILRIRALTGMLRIGEFAEDGMTDRTVVERLYQEAHTLALARR